MCSIESSEKLCGTAKEKKNMPKALGHEGGTLERERENEREWRGAEPYHFFDKLFH
jgi:hypothetical protein